ncbi:hypothetical protein JTB14_001023 [Gonioctena quinquepunctata]|nr:hypothetical protein JTB14_001023 [Gonioctena quinquepunctata]
MNTREPECNEELIIMELKERQKKNSYNLSETDKSDLDQIKDIVKEVTNQDQDRNFKVIRVGKGNKNGVRALKVVFSSTEEALRVLKNKRNIDKARKIFIDADLTPRQLQHL